MSESKKIAQLRDRLADIENNSVEPLSELSLRPGAAALATKVGTKLGDLGAQLGAPALSQQLDWRLGVVAPLGTIAA